MNNITIKIEPLKRRFQEIESAVVAFSGGVDSSLLAVVASYVLREKMIAVTADSPSLPRSDKKLVEDFCRTHKIPHKFVETSEFNDEEYLSNPSDRCYLCKKHIYGALIKVCDELNFKHIIEGTNASDLHGHRPGYRASKENERVLTPLIECNFSKLDVREAARHLKISTSDKPSSACLSSRIRSGCRITSELLKRIDLSEDAIRDLGISQVRVRTHDDLARIEVDLSDIVLCFENREMISVKLKELGWKYVTIDILGYRTGGGM